MPAASQLLGWVQRAVAVADERRRREGTRGAMFNVNAVRENPELLQYPMYKGYRGLDKDQLALVDRYTHGAGYAEDLPQTRLGPVDPVGWAGMLGAAAGGTGAEMVKLLGQDDTARSVVTAMGGDQAQAQSFERSPATSTASPFNVLALLRGFADARWGEEQE